MKNLALLFCLVGLSCKDKPNDTAVDPPEADADTDADTDTDTDADSDSDADSDTDTDSDTDADCVLCAGYFVVQNSQDLKDATSCVSIDGTLRLVDLYWVEELSFPCLESIVGSHDYSDGLHIEANQVLTTASFSSLSSVEAEIALQNNPLLSEVDFGSLQQAGWYVGVQHNSLLEGLEGFANLETVGETLTIQGNTSLFSLEGMRSLTHVSLDLQIYDNPMLCQSEAEAFAGRIEVSGDVWVLNNGTARTDCK
jgi:hypothetical protein